MSDLFDEIDDELRRQRVEALLKKYKWHMIGLAIAIVVSVGGWRFYQHQRQLHAAEAGSRYEEALNRVRAGKVDEAEAMLKTIVAGDSAGYKTLARFMLAGLAARKDPAAGLEAYDALASDSGVEAGLRKAATLRAGLMRIDHAPFSEVKTKIEPLATGADDYRHMAREILALSALRARDHAEADKWLQTIIGDAATPQDLRQRADTMMTVLAGGSQG